MFYTVHIYWVGLFYFR